MKPAQIFRLVVRLIGVFAVIYILKHLLVVWHRIGSPHLDQPVLLLIELILMGIGVFMIYKPEFFLNILFPEDSEDDKR